MIIKQASGVPECDRVHHKLIFSAVTNNKLQWQVKQYVANILYSSFLGQMFL